MDGSRWSWTGSKKNLRNYPERRTLVDPEHPDLSIQRQCELLGLSRSTYYYVPKGETEENLSLMRLIDEKYTAAPFYGSRKMLVWLHEIGHKVNRKRVQRLMRKMALEAIYPKPKLSKRQQQHKVYPYLLRGVRIERRNQVWSSDITYIRVLGGFLYLTAIIDWYSRYVLSWELSNTLEADFCVGALEKALHHHGVPEIFNTDQGSQFTSADFTEVLLDRGVKISMDGRGRALDNIFVERLWRTVKYEEVYLNDYSTGLDAYHGLGRYFGFYNEERHHQALDYLTPRAVYLEAKEPTVLTGIDLPKTIPVPGSPAWN